MSNLILNQYNKNFGLAQNLHFTGRMISMPVNNLCLEAGATKIFLDKKQAHKQSYRRLEQLSLDASDLIPLPSNSVFVERLKSPSASSVVFENSVFGATILISSSHEVNTPENLSEVSSTLLNDYKSRLNSALIDNYLKSKGVHYQFTNGGTGTEGKMNKTDLRNCCKILEKNRADRVVRKSNPIRNQSSSTVGAIPSGQGYALISSIDSKFTIMEALSDQLKTPFELANMNDYAYSFYGFLREPQLYFSSDSEMTNNSTSARAYILGKDAYGVTVQNPLSSRFILKGQEQYDLNLHYSLSMRHIFDCKLLRGNQRLVNATFSK